MDPWTEFIRFMDQTCESCGCLLNNAPECDPNLNDDKGCPHTRRSMYRQRDRTEYLPGGIEYVGSEETSHDCTCGTPDCICVFRV